MQSALGLGWIEKAIVFWRTVLSGHDLTEETFASLDDHASIHARMVLQQLRDLKTGSHALTGLFVICEQSLRGLLNLLLEKAEEIGIDADMLLSKLMNLWVSDDYSDRAGFLQGALKSRTLVMSWAQPTAK